MNNPMQKPMWKVLRDDMNTMIDKTGKTVVFEWKEVEGGVWNEVYETWEGGKEVKKTYSEICSGKIIWYKEDLLTTEYGRMNVGDCILRFRYDSSIFDILRNKRDVVFTFENQRFSFNSPFDIGDEVNDKLYSKIIRGVKATE